jgi:hypothetical protein
VASSSAMGTTVSPVRVGEVGVAVAAIGDFPAVAGGKGMGLRAGVNPLSLHIPLFYVLMPRTHQLSMGCLSSLGCLSSMARRLGWHREG